MIVLAENLGASVKQKSKTKTTGLTRMKSKFSPITAETLCSSANEKFFVHLLTKKTAPKDTFLAATIKQLPLPQSLCRRRVSGGFFISIEVTRENSQET